MRVKIAKHGNVLRVRLRLLPVALPVAARLVTVKQREDEIGAGRALGCESI